MHGMCVTRKETPPSRMVGTLKREFPDSVQHRHGLRLSQAVDPTLLYEPRLLLCWEITVADTYYTFFLCRHMCLLPTKDLP